MVRNVYVAVANSNNDGENPCVSFKLPADMTIETVEELAGELKQLAILEKTTIKLDASEVERITTPGAQLIVALEKTLSSQGGMLVIVARSEAFIHALREMGLEGFSK